MRIAFFHNLPSGGAKRTAYELIKHLSKHHEVDLFVYDKQSEDFLDIRPLVSSTISVENGNSDAKKGLNRLFSLIKVRRASKQLAHLVNQGNYEVSLIMQCKVTNSPFLLRYLNVPSLYFCHEPLAKILEPHYQKDKKGSFVGFLTSMYLRWLVSVDKSNALKATQLCTSSLYCIESLYRNYGIYARLNYLGVDHQNFKPLGLPRTPILLFVGALNPAKGQDFIVESVGTMEHRPMVRFIYNFSYGTEGFKEQLIIRARQLGVSISFENMADDVELVKAYNSAILTVFPSRLEPLGLVPLESMACGTPVIGVAEAGIRETIIHNETGLLTERDPVEFGKAIDKLIKDKELWATMSKNSINEVSTKWTWEQSFLKLEENLNRTLELYKIKSDFLS